MNAIVGQKFAITSSKPQTTRKAIRAILNREDSQLIIVDLPGVHRPRTLLGQRLNDLVTSTLTDVDVIAFCSPANEKIGPGDKHIVADLERFPKSRKIAIVTKVDTVSKQRLAEHLMDVQAMGEWAEIVPVSGLKGIQVELLSDLLFKQLPVSPKLYPDDVETGESEDDLICELVREAALELVEDELPHSLAVTLDEIVLSDDKPNIHVSLWVERDSQKGMVIGKGGSLLKEVGTAVRKQLPKGTYLELAVVVDKNWQQRPERVERLGY
jgi:GTP-binding protein Era